MPRRYLARQLNIMKNAFFCLVLFLCAGLSSAAQKLVFEGKPELVFPNLVSTKESEIKLTFSPDGKRMLWGTIGWENGAGGWDIWESVRENNAWSQPRAVSFNSDANDFDPSFAPDGKGVFFFSNRAGGAGGDDIYYAAFDKKTGAYGKAVNLGETINSKGDEWGAIVSPDNKTLLYCTDGRGGSGKHDLFISHKTKNGWSAAQNLGATINSPLDDFDPTFLHDGKTIVFASERAEKDKVDLYVSYFVNGAYTTPENLGAGINSADRWDFGTAISLSEPGVLYFNSNFSDNQIGKVDVYKIKYRLEKK